ncbi:hypothetical protein KSP40_PGU017423 [Platanthera guangdongensis]|uniref:Uncharacterized protein n=1 Tax=Platanthera guangdongensis TaxID=2320717 RepID=A0ABR2LXT8_9ASPA
MTNPSKRILCEFQQIASRRSCQSPISYGRPTFPSSKNLFSDFSTNLFAPGRICSRFFYLEPSAKSSSLINTVLTRFLHTNRGSCAPKFPHEVLPSGFPHLRKISSGFSTKSPNLSSKVTGLRNFVDKESISRLLPIKSFNSGKIAEGLSKSMVSKPLSSVTLMFSRYREAISLQLEAFWKRNYLFILGAGGLVLCIALWRMMFGIATTFVGLSEGMAKYGFLALAASIVAFTSLGRLCGCSGTQSPYTGLGQALDGGTVTLGVEVGSPLEVGNVYPGQVQGLYVRSRFIINPDKVYRMAMRKLNTSAPTLEVLGAPLAGTDVRAYIMSGGMPKIKNFKLRLGGKRCFLIFPIRGSERRGLVSVEVKKRKGKVSRHYLSGQIIFVKIRVESNFTVLTY